MKQPEYMHEKSGYLSVFNNRRHMKILYTLLLLFALDCYSNNLFTVSYFLINLNKHVEYVKIFPYNHFWKIIFANEAASLQQIFGENKVVSIEHFGSTSIPEMSAKPVVDIIIGLSKFKLSDNDLEKLFKLGYNFIEDSPYCQRFYLQKRGPINVNLSITKYKSETWKDCLSVRDYLRTHPNYRQKYKKIKNEAMEKGYNSIEKYSAYKQFFFKRLVKNARAWWSDE